MAAGVTVTGISPATGSTAGGASVTLTGTGFLGVTSVVFGGTAARSFTIVDANTITAVSPASSAGGTVDVTVNTAAGASATSPADQFTYIPVPTVTRVSPNSGPVAGGTAVTLTGTGFSTATAVKLGATSITGFTIASDTSITLTTPAGTAGSVTFTVTNPGGTSSGTSSARFTYLGLPTVTSISPAAGPEAGGTSVTITGTNFLASTSTNTVKFGTTAATITSATTTQLRATAPAGTGTAHITVTNTGGTSTTSAADQYSFAPVPAITSISPTAGSTGTIVMLAGSGFTGATGVLFGGAAATSFNVNTDSSISATAPSGAGTVHLTVTTPGGTSATSAADQYTYGGMTVTAGSVTGATVGASYSQANPANGGVSPYHYTVASGALPAGTSLDASTGVVSGTPTTAGSFSYAIKATDSAGTPASATGSTVSGSIAQGSQTLSFTTTAPTTAAVGGAPYMANASSTSGLDVAITVDASSASVCSISSNVVTFQAVGTCKLDANQGGDGDFTAAGQIQQSFAVGQGSQTISFTTLAPTGATVGVGSYTPAASATSGLPVTISVDPGSTSVCSMSSGAVSFNHDGTCTLDANQAGNADFAGASQAQQSFAVAAPPPPPAPVPTLNQWMALILGGLFVGLGSTALQRRV